MREFDLQKFIVDSHEKIIGHYRRLLESSTSEIERERFRRCLQEEEHALRRALKEQPASRAA